MDRRNYDEPSNVAADRGEVLVDGPDGVAVSLTPEAAMVTADRLVEGAAAAAGQRHNAKTKPIERYGERNLE
jgi:hypothetical protein